LLGGGMELAFACDIRIASGKAFFNVQYKEKALSMKY